MLLLGFVVQDLATGFADVEGGGDDGGEGAGQGAGGETDEEGGGVVVVLGLVERGVKGCQSVADGFVAPPVYAAERDVAPHCECETAPERGVALRVDHFLEPGEGFGEDACAA